jgi:hypothetical protein
MRTLALIPAKLANAAPVAVLAIAVYFALVWGFESARMLAQPAYGLDDVWRSQFLFAIGRVFALSPLGLIKLAAFFATLKLAAAVACLGYLVARIRAWPDRIQSDVLEAGLIIIVAVSILAAGPAVWSQDVALVREHTFGLLLASAAVALCLYERRKARADAPAVNPFKVPAWFTPWR